MSIRDKAKDDRAKRSEDAYAVISASYRAKNLDRWMELSGVTDPQEIDYTLDPIALEFLLCDVHVLADISGGRRLDKFLERLTDAQKDLYFNTVDEDGASYRDLEDPKVLKKINRALKCKFLYTLD